jgi:hypothetical protein
MPPRNCWLANENQARGKSDTNDSLPKYLAAGKVVVSLAMKSGLAEKIASALAFSRVVLEGGKLADASRDVQIQRAEK